MLKIFKIADDMEEFRVDLKNLFTRKTRYVERTMVRKDVWLREPSFKKKFSRLYLVRVVENCLVFDTHVIEA